MRNSAGRIPIPDETAELTPVDFAHVLLLIPEECVLIGGQAVVWWAERYGLKSELNEKEAITNRDIEFWGSADDLRIIASCLPGVPVFPNKDEVTSLVGAIELEAGEKKTVLRVLHSVPGLDSIDPHKTAVAERVKAPTAERKLLVLSPVSLVLTKLHALRAVDQNNRHDLLHLLVCLKASRVFIEELSKQDARCAMWNCQRLIDAQWQKPNRTLEREYGFRILESVPITTIRMEAAKKAGNAGEHGCGSNGQQEAGLAIYDGKEEWKNEPGNRYTPEELDEMLRSWDVTIENPFSPPDV